MSVIDALNYNDGMGWFLLMFGVPIWLVTLTGCASIIRGWRKR